MNKELNLKKVNNKKNNSSSQNENNEDSDILFEQFTSLIQNEIQEDKSIIKGIQKMEQKQNNKTDVEEKEQGKKSTNYTNNSNNKSEGYQKKGNKLHDYDNQYNYLTQLNFQLHQGYSLQEYYQEDDDFPQKLKNPYQENLHQDYNDLPYYSTPNKSYPEQGNFPPNKWSQKEKEDNCFNHSLYQGWGYRSIELNQETDFNPQKELYLQQGHQFQKISQIQENYPNHILNMDGFQTHKCCCSEIPKQQYHQLQNLYNKYDLWNQQDLSMQQEYQEQLSYQQNNFSINQVLPIQMMFPLQKQFMISEFLPQHVLSFEKVYQPKESFHKYDYPKADKRLLREQNLNSFRKKRKKRRKINKKKLFRRAQKRKAKRKNSFRKFYSLKANENKVYPKKYKNLFLRNKNKSKIYVIKSDKDLNNDIQKEKFEDIKYEEINNNSIEIKKEEIRINEKKEEEEKSIFSFGKELDEKPKISKAQNEVDKIFKSKKNEIAHNEIGNKENKNLENIDISLSGKNQNKSNNNIIENSNKNEENLVQEENHIPNTHENHIIFTDTNSGENNQQNEDYQILPDETNFETIYNNLNQFANHLGNDYTDLEQFNYLDDIPQEDENYNADEVFQGNLLDIEQNNRHYFGRLG